MLRYVSTFDEQDITLMDEISHVRNYLDLMKARYEHHFSCRIEADEEATAFSVNISAIGIMCSRI